VKVKTARIHCLASLLLASASLATDSAEMLFNGRDLTGWTIMNNGAFSVTNGILHLERSLGWLRTDRQFSDFVLEAEWRALETNYNSGFFIRAGTVGKPFPDNAWQVNLKESALGALLKGRDTVVSSKTSKFPVGEWVTFRMEVRGKKLTLDVNGTRAMEFDALDVDRGYIGIQAEGKSFDFRNIHIREISRVDSLKTD
jgi:hypothetical protein